MKKSYAQAALLSAALILGAPALAQYTGPQQQAALSTVTKAASAADDTHVILEGYLASKIRGEHYTFKDATGSIEVEIDAKHFPTSTAINEKTKVRLHGKVDKDFGKDATIDVKQVEVL